jgi:outer membrane protein TolC
VRGEVRQAAAQARQAQWALERVRRSAALDIRDAYTELTAAQASHDALTQAQAAAEEDYRLQQEDYQLSLVNNLDVLESLEDLQAVRRQVIAAKYDVHRRYWRLRVATGDTL